MLKIDKLVKHKKRTILQKSNTRVPTSAPICASKSCMSIRLVIVAIHVEIDDNTHDKLCPLKVNDMDCQVELICAPKSLVAIHLTMMTIYVKMMAIRVISHIN